MRKLLTNKVKCLKCGDILESKYEHDLKCCECESITISGGTSYAYRSISDPETYEELSTYDAINVGAKI